MINICYVFRSEDGRVENFEEHVLGVLECIESRWESRGLVNKISRVTNTDKRVVEWLIRLSAVLHDVGKLDVGTQSSCRERFCINFPYHYVTSAKFATRLGVESGTLCGSIKDRFNNLVWSDKEWNKMDGGDLYLTLVVLPVLLHHYAGIKEKSIQEGLIKCGDLFKIDASCKDALLNVISELERDPPEEFKILVDKFKDIVRKGETSLELLPGITSTLFTYRISLVKLLIEATTGLLNICDGIVAGKNRVKRVEYSRKRLV